MNQSLNQMLFGPIDRKYCLYFYYVSVFAFLLLIMLFFSSLYIGLFTKIGNVITFQMVLMALGYAAFYLQNRLLYSMCINSL